MTEPVQALSAWLSDHSAMLNFDLNQPADSDSIESLQVEIGEELPSAFVDLYKCFNGQGNDSSRDGIFYGILFMPLKDVLRYVKGVELAPLVDQALSEVDTTGKVKKYCYNPKWVPFADDSGGNYLGLDFDPGAKGRKGQVINFGRDEERSYILANSFEEFIIWYMEQLNSGNYILAERNTRRDSVVKLQFTIKRPPNLHFFDTLSHYFS